MSQTNFAQDVDRVCGPSIRPLPCLQIELVPLVCYV
jgi:hypothetical protein